MNRRFGPQRTELRADLLEQCQLVLQKLPEFARVGVIDLLNDFPVPSFAKTDPAKKQWFREGEMLPLDGRRRNRYVVNHRIIESLSVGMPQNKNRQVNVSKLMAVALSGRIRWRKKS